MGDNKHEASKAVMSIKHFLWILGDRSFPKRVHHINFGEQNPSSLCGKLFNWTRTTFLYFRSTQQKFNVRRAFSPNGTNGQVKRTTMRSMHTKALQCSPCPPQ